MSFRYAAQKIPRYSLRILFIHLCKDTNALVKPKGMMQYSYSLYRVQKAVFHSSPAAILLHLDVISRVHSLDRKDPVAEEEEAQAVAKGSESLGGR